MVMEHAVTYSEKDQETHLINDKLKTFCGCEVKQCSPGENP
jgi:hypothetical protein